MKKLIIIVVLLTAFGFSGFSQSGVFSGGFGNRELRETGWLIRPETGVVGTGYVASLMVGVTIGRQITPHIYLGGGINCCVNPFKRGYDVYTGTMGYSNEESLFASFRWYWLDRRSSPFLELSVGIERYAYYGSNWYDDDYYYYDYNYNYRSRRGFGPYANVAIGYDIRNFDIQLGACNSFLNYGRFSVTPYLSLGYNFLIKK